MDDETNPYAVGSALPADDEIERRSGSGFGIAALVFALLSSVATFIMFMMELEFEDQLTRRLCFTPGGVCSVAMAGVGISLTVFGLLKDRMRVWSCLGLAINGAVVLCWLGLLLLGTLISL